MRIVESTGPNGCSSHRRLSGRRIFLVLQKIFLSALTSASGRMTIVTFFRFSDNIVWIVAHPVCAQPGRNDQG